jgi:hypothetical protein
VDFVEGPSKTKRLIFAAALVALFVLNLALYGPLFSAQERPYRGSIASGYAGITRFVAEHPNPWGWNPQQYAGQPTQFTYPPLVPYVSAALHWMSGIEPFWAYRLTIAFFACIGPVTLALGFYWFFARRRWAILLGLAYTLLSPAYGLFERIDTDRGLYYLPWRLLVLMKYGEGPHIVGLSLLPLILAAVVWGARRKDFASLFLMAVALATAPLLNWLCAFALTISLLVLWLSDTGLIRRSLLAGLLGYGLACFWLTPEYVFTTLFNWPKDSYGYQVEQSHWPLYLGLLALLAAAKLGLKRLEVPWNLQALTLLALTFFWIVGGFYLAGRDTIPESRRYSLELELFLMSALAGWMSWAVRSKEGVDKFCVALCLVAFTAGGAGQLSQSVKRRWSDWGFQDREQLLEFQLAKWLESQKPQGRVFATGGLRFRLNAWTRLHQVGGTFESGLRERIAVDRYYQVRTGEASKKGDEGADALRQLAALGVEYVVIHDLESEEYYKDFKNPFKLKDLAPVAYQASPHDWVHKLPYTSHAHLLQPNEVPKDRYKESLGPLAAAIADPQRPKLAWRERHPSLYEIEGAVRPNDLIFVSMNFDAGWRASQDGAPIAVERDNMGLIQLRPRPKAVSTITLEYAGTTQQILFAGISAVIWLASLALLRRDLNRKR